MDMPLGQPRLHPNIQVHDRRSSPKNLETQAVEEVIKYIIEKEKVTKGADKTLEG